MDTPFPDSTPLTYTIAGCSEHSGRYVAQNILVDSPLDQGSRWSGAYQTTNASQWLLLRLDKICVLKCITFGKFYKPHPCNMKEFRIYIGMSEENMTEVLHSGLKNDAIPETFAVRHINHDGIYFPTRFVKIVPLSAHGQSFHTSIWYVSMTGVSDELFVRNIKDKYEEYREKIVLRHVLKHLRQRRFLTPCLDIISRSGIQLEHPTITSLYTALVMHGDWALAENLLHDCSQAGFLSNHIHSRQVHSLWTPLNGLDEDGNAPGKRSGHAMCMDVANGLIYLLGGWDGEKNLDDFWVYDVMQDKWRILSHATSEEKNGPGPRACHKMVFDYKTGAIYLSGRMDEREMFEAKEREPSPSADVPTTTTSSTTQHGTDGPQVSPSGEITAAFYSEFYRYHTRGLDTGKWDLLCFDTASAGGPPLVYDHQMIMDSEAQAIYISGGRVVDEDWESAKYAGLYCYDVRRSKWTVWESPDSPGSFRSTIPSRFGHSMVFDPHAQTLFIFGGQREEKFLSDMYAFHVPSNTVTELFANFTASGGPNACFTQRAVIDPDLREIYVFYGLTRARHGSATMLDSEAPYWTYRYERADRPGTWSRILPEGTQDVVLEVPRPRYAHQIAYDSRAKIVYIHGGNAQLGEDVDAQDSDKGHADVDDAARDDRLSDFWSLRLKRPTPKDVERRVVYLIRQQQFREMCEDAPAVKALAFLQTTVSSVVDHSNAEEASAFRSLLSHLLSRTTDHTDNALDNSSRKRSRPDSPVVDGGEAKRERSSGSHTGDIKLRDPLSAPSRSVVTKDRDPLEKGCDAQPPSPERFKQRTNVFERLMTFMNEDAKQPERNLLDLVKADE